MLSKPRILALSPNSFDSSNNESWVLLRLETLFCSIHLQYEHDEGHLGKSATIRESNLGLGVCKEHYA